MTANYLEGISVVDFSSSLSGVQLSQFLADYGAEVIFVEPPGGSPLRNEAAWPFWGRGKQSVVLDLNEADDLKVADFLLARADIAIETWTPGTAERMGVGYERHSLTNCRLIYASISGFGRDNSLSHIKGYEAVVMAKIGALDAFSSLADRPGPAFVAAPYATWSAGQLALHGVLAAVFERESSGLGQHVDSTLVQGVLAQDIGNWLVSLVAERYGDAFVAVPPADHELLVPNSDLFFRLLVALSADGRWMQFSQNSPRLWEAFLRVAGLEWTHDDPFLKGSSESDDPLARVGFWNEALKAIRAKTYEDWLAVFEEEPDVWAELFRTGSEALHHEQLVHDDQVAEVDDPTLGTVRQLARLVGVEGSTLGALKPAPRLDAHGDGIRLRRNEVQSPQPAVGDLDRFQSNPPLEGVTVVEIGNFFAGPFGAAILTDYGARVIKVEQLGGDPMRHLFAFPEIGGIKVLQGKESIAVDMTRPEGRSIVLELVRRSDAVLQSFRGGVAERHGYGADDLLAVNPELVYLGAYGYGPGGPCGRRPAFAPTFGAAVGLGYRNVGGPENLPQGCELSQDEVKRYSLRLSTAIRGVAHADGISALGTATALLLGLVGKRRGMKGQAMVTTMLSTMAHALSEEMVEYQNRPAVAVPDRELLGLHATYRLYESSDGWIFLAAPSARDRELISEMFAIDCSNEADQADLERTLADTFRRKPGALWEAELTSAGVACVTVEKGPVEQVTMKEGGLGSQLGITTEASHAILGTYPRLSRLAQMSRSREVKYGPAPLCGEQTDSVLMEIGYDDAAIRELRLEKVIG